MKIGLDADGVLYPFEEGLKIYLVDHAGVDPATLGPVTQWHLYEDWGMTRAQFKEHYHAAIDAGVLFNRPGPYEGTREALQQLVDAGHTLHIVTARGDAGTPGRAEGMTKFWAAAHLPEITSLTFSSDKTIVRTDVFIEDKIENYDRLHYTGVRTTLINRPYNQQENDWPWRRRVDSMQEFADDVLHLAAGQRAA